MGQSFGTPSSRRLRRPRELALAQLSREMRAPSAARIPSERTQIPGTCTGSAAMGTSPRRRPRLSIVLPAKGVEPSGRQPGRLRVAGSNWQVCYILSPSHSASSDQDGHEDTSPCPLPPRPTERLGRAGNQRHCPPGGPAGDSRRGLTGHPSAGDPGNPPPCGEWLRTIPHSLSHTHLHAHSHTPIK